MTQEVFHTLTLGDLRFEAIMGQRGPSLLSPDHHAGLGLGACASVHKFDDGYWLVQDKTRKCINLSSLTMKQIKRLCDEFGIPGINGPVRTAEGDAKFFRSNAFFGLVCWVKKNPRLSLRYKCCNVYASGWLNKVIEAIETEQRLIA